MHRTKEKKPRLGILLYYYAHHLPSFAIVLCTNMAVLARDWKLPITYTYYYYFFGQLFHQFPSIIYFRYCIVNEWMNLI